ncbi:MAG: hypothetical protein R3F43_00820 [bacterium]
MHRIRGARGQREEHTYTIRHHYLSPEVLPDLLAQAGLRLVALFGELDESPLDGATGWWSSPASAPRPARGP